jgi:hypothetical protein
MSYTSMVEMTTSTALKLRVAACAADEGLDTDPAQWAEQNMWRVVVAADWVAAWDSAVATHSDNFNPDTGARDDVITDAMILSVVQPMVNPPAGDE